MSVSLVFVTHCQFYDHIIILVIGRPSTKYCAHCKRVIASVNLKLKSFNSAKFFHENCISDRRFCPIFSKVSDFRTAKCFDCRLWVLCLNRINRYWNSVYGIRTVSVKRKISHRRHLAMSPSERHTVCNMPPRLNLILLNYTDLI